MADKCFANVYPYQVVIGPETPALAWTDILALARLHSISVDGAAYLELALGLDLPLPPSSAAPLSARRPRPGRRARGRGRRADR